MTGNPTVAVCKECGLLYTSPRYSEKEIAAYYASEFASDPGASGFIEGGASGLEQVEFAQSVEDMRASMLPLVEKHVNPRGKKWLELRFRTGAAIRMLDELGAETWGLDIFEANVRSARARFGRETFISASVFDLFSQVNETFDVISALTIHVLAHAPSPTRLLADIYDHLKEDGLLLLEEKDVQEIPPASRIFPLAHPNPIAHYHHMTLGSGRAFVEKAGFEIVFADYIPRTSALRHFLIVARRPRGERAVAAAPRADHPARLYASMVSHFEAMTGRAVA
jgi:SAM-dependent methyltransferase